VEAATNNEKAEDLVQRVAHLQQVMERAITYIQFVIKEGKLCRLTYAVRQLCKHLSAESWTDVHELNDYYAWSD